jgi:protease I
MAGVPLAQAEENLAPKALDGVRIVALVDNGFHPEETSQPIAYWEALGATVIIAGPEKGVIKAAYGPQELTIAVTPDALSPADYDAVFIPGGTAPAKLRQHEAVLALVRTAVEEAKLVAAICHGPQVLITAGVLDGREATCVVVEARDYFAVKQELEEAGAIYRNEPVVIDGAIITSRLPSDVPVFQRAVAQALADK